MPIGKVWIYRLLFVCLFCVLLRLRISPPIIKLAAPKRCKIGCKLVLMTNRKSYMSFRLVPKSVTLNDLERRNGPYFLRYFTDIGGFRGALPKSG